MKQDASNDEPRDDEEDINAEESAMDSRNTRVEEHHQHHSKRPKGLDIRSKRWFVVFESELSHPLNLAERSLRLATQVGVLCSVWGLFCVELWSPNCENGDAEHTEEPSRDDAHRG